MKYSSVTATYTYTVGEYVSAETITLEPQTTPFTTIDTVRRNGCAPDLYCAYSPESVTPGATCLVWDWVDDDHGIAIRSECYPTGYFQLFWHGTGWGE